MDERAVLAGKKANLALRCRIIQIIRSFFLERGFLEVQTPVRTPAPAPERHIDAPPSDGWYLAPSPELYMKRLLAAGYEKIFQIAPAFRKGETGRFHHSEFTLLEWYRLDADYTFLQHDCRELFSELCRQLDRPPRFLYQGRVLSVNEPWQELTVAEAFRRWAGWQPGADPDPDRFDLDLVEKIEPRLGLPTPCLLSDYPASQAALARLKPDDPSVAERFELYWAGIELANGFSELTDPDEQRRRFLETAAQRKATGRPVYPLPEAFLESLHHLPAAAGIALGIDRLVMLLADAHHIDQVVAFAPGCD